MVTRPMLAGQAPEDLGRLRYPVLVTPKIDGIRCLKVNGKALTRSFKPLRNTFIRTWIEKNLPDGVDGELIVKGAAWNVSASGIMSEFGEPNFEYKVFDLVTNLLDPYEKRVEGLLQLTRDHPDRVHAVIPEVADSVDRLLELEKGWLQAKFEGIMIRDPKGPYKCGRSTLREGWLLKLKRFADGEAIIVGFQELFHNTNAAVEDAFGLAKRSAQSENMVPAGMLGALTVCDIQTKKVFAIGTGFDLAMRKEIWEKKSEYINKIVKYKYQVLGTVDLPRIPVFLGFRDLRDMDVIVRPHEEV